MLQQALSHRSWVHENLGGESSASNERLEFLGDAVLELIVAEHLYREFPSYSEGELTECRRMLVEGRLLAAKGEQLGLGADVRLSSGEEESGGRRKPSILTDVYEALLGAIFLDGGLKAAKRFVENIHLADRDSQLESEKNLNYKGLLLEKFQAMGKHPEYRTVSEEGPNHRKLFRVAVFLGGKEIGRGTGSNKKAAEQAAAKEALGKIK